MDPNLILDEGEKGIQPSPILTIKDVLTKIWLSPREVFKFVIEHKYAEYATLLVILATIARILHKQTVNGIVDLRSLAIITSISVIIGILLSWVLYQILASLIKWTGTWIGGKALDSESIFRVLAYASIPSALMLLVLILQMSVFGLESFYFGNLIITTRIFPHIVFWIFFGLKALLGIITLVYSIVAISEVQQFNILKSILNLGTAIFFLTAPIAIILSIFMRL
ncbi:MAG: hypothetical protein R2792_09530 [Saprospiraceae bacterium]